MKLAGDWLQSCLKIAIHSSVTAAVEIRAVQSFEFLFQPADADAQRHAPAEWGSGGCYSAAIIRVSAADRIGMPSIDRDGLPSTPTSGSPTSVIR